MREDEMDDRQDLDVATEAEGRRLLAAALDSVPAEGELASGGLAGAELLRRVRRGRQSSRRRVRTLVPAGAVAAAGGVAALVVSLTVASAPSALAAMTAAAAKTSAESFTATATATQWTVPASDDNGPPLRTTGVYGTGRGLAAETVAGSEVRIVDGHVYFNLGSKWAFVEKLSSHGKPWIEGLLRPSQTSGTSFGVIMGYIGNDDEPTNPGALLEILKSVASVTAAGPASGPGWTGTKYTFTERFSNGGVPQKVSGTVYVDRQGRVRHLVMTQEYPIWFSDNEKATAFDQYNATFSGFGVHVSVTAPPASQVYNLGQQYLSVNALGGPVFSGPRP